MVKCSFTRMWRITAAQTLIVGMEASGSGSSRTGAASPQGEQDPKPGGALWNWGRGIRTIVMDGGGSSLILKARGLPSLRLQMAPLRQLRERVSTGHQAVGTKLR